MLKYFLGSEQPAKIESKQHFVVGVFKFCGWSAAPRKYFNNEDSPRRLPSVTVSASDLLLSLLTY